MRNYILVLLAVLIFASCENKKQTEQINVLTEEQSRLLAEAQQRDSIINGYLQTLNEIEVNLAEIKARENLISKQTATGELSAQSRARIREDILLINDLMLKNKEKIAALSDQIKNSNVKINELNKMIKLAEDQMKERDTEIAGLKTQLEQKNLQVTYLTDTIQRVRTEKQEVEEINEQLIQTVEARTNELNTAYFIIGEGKELVDRGILERQGGFLGMGKSYNVKSEVDLNNFTKVDIRNLKSIPLGVKKLNIMSVHPGGTFEIVKDGENVKELVITDYNKFWEKSRLLVLLISK